MTKETLTGTFLGIGFACISFLLKYTVIVPVLSVMPSILLELMAGAMVQVIPVLDSRGQACILLLLLLFLSYTFYILHRIRQKKIHGKPVAFNYLLKIMTIEYFIVHSLGFYLYWYLCMDFRPDGQIIFAAVDSFSYSSLSFIPLGILIDCFKANPAMDSRR